ncbi:MAG TPA: GTP cyclohydrolase, FolE2/MptA family [Conexivisphaerales archaeon]|nr:GTP cyclohydrolase, FolE2/MptA family [Conexivisphaerales archaeon]
MELNLEADVQSEYSRTDVRAGITGLKMMVRVGRYVLPSELTVTTLTQHSRGVHMSRLVSAAQENSGKEHVEDALKAIARASNMTQKGTCASVRFSYPFKDIFVPVEIGLRKGVFTYIMKAPGITACPCSKKMAGVGHMQRAWLTMATNSRSFMDIEEQLVKMLSCFSAETTAMMKRADEAMRVVESQRNPRFVEDVVRDAAKKFPEAYYLEARSEESIHMHDAVAVVDRR